MPFYSPGDVIITAILLSGEKLGTLDVTNIVIELDIYGDLMVPGYNCSMTLIDPANLHNLVPLTGGGLVPTQFIYVNFHTPGLASFVHTFAITTVEDAKHSSALRVKAYKLTGVAVEAFKNKQTLVSKSYLATFDAIVTDLFRNFLGSAKGLIVQPTRGIQEYIVTNERPFDAINKIRKRSASAQYPSSTYLMFENQGGYQYVTLESLFGPPFVATYINSDVGARNAATDLNFRVILGYNIPDLFNMTLKIGQGAFGSLVKTIDLKTLLFATGLAAAPGFATGGIAATGAGISSFIPNDLTRPPTFIDEFIARQRAFLANHDQLKLHLKIFGDSTLDVGQAIFINIIVNDDTTGPRILDNVPPFGIAGSYIITKIVSTIMPADVSPRFLQVIECMAG